jgi:hypothetical protein
MAVLRRRVRDILERLEFGGDSVELRASGFINLVLGDAYLEAALGLDDPDWKQRFEAQITLATDFALSPPQGGTP